MAPTIDIIRAAHADVNPDGRADVSEAIGMEQCWDLISEYPHRRWVRHIVSSPLIRAIQTAQYCFLFPEFSTPQITLLPGLQETSIKWKDIGEPLSRLAGEFGYGINTSELAGEDWYRKDRGTAMFPSWDKVEERARLVRLWLRDRALPLHDRDRIVVVTHGFFAHFLTQDFNGITLEDTAGHWLPARCRSFQFADVQGQDDQARLEETPESRSTLANWKPLSDDEHAQRKALAAIILQSQEPVIRSSRRNP
ncbi:histidine phosphatase superfamily [Xylaria intraflava]|nr:histidine phosphatase superfamily [Xylaria intraflava]